MEYNYGKLRSKKTLGKNIIYYKSGEDELSVNITNRCPNNCCFCIRDRFYGWGELNLYLEDEPSLCEILGEISKSLKENRNIVKVKICGYGEPIIRIKLLPKIISIIKKEHPKIIVQLATSGWPLYDIEDGIHYFKESVKNGLDIVYLGMHATDIENYAKKVRPNISPKKAFNRVVEFIKLSKSLNLKVVCAFVDLDDLSLSEIKNFTKELNCEYDIRNFRR